MTKQSTQKVSAKRMYAMNQRVGPFAEERARYIEHLRKRGWALATLCGTASNLNAFADRVDIDSEGDVTLAQVEAAADDWMKQPGHNFRRAIGPHRSRTRFVNVAVNWLRFMGRFREPEGAPIPYADLVTEFCVFLERERELAAESVSLKRIHVLNFLAWFAQEGRPFNEVNIEDVKRYLALPRGRPWSRVTIAGCVASLRTFFRFAGTRKWCTPNIGDAIDAPRLYTLATLPTGPSWEQVKQLIASFGQKKPTFVTEPSSCCSPSMAFAAARFVICGSMIWIGNASAFS